MSPHLNLKHLISSVVSLAQLVSPRVALSAELVIVTFLTRGVRNLDVLLLSGGGVNCSFYRRFKIPLYNYH